MDADDDADVNVEVEEDGEEAVVHPTSLDNKTPAFLIQHYQTGVAVYRPGSASNCAVTAYAKLRSAIRGMFQHMRMDHYVCVIDFDRD